jgi:hypothetical protein
VVTSVEPGNSMAAHGAWEKVTLFSFGVVFFVILLAVAWFDKDPTPTSWYIYNCVLAMAAGGIAALLPGALALNWHPAIRATGALAIAVIVFYSGKDRNRAEAKVQDLASWLVFQPVEKEDTPIPSPRAGDLYVVINGKIVQRDVVSAAPKLSLADASRAKDITVTRGPGGIRVDFKTLSQGDRVFVALDDKSHWWKSGDMTIPEAQLLMTAEAFDGIVNRISNAR